MVAGRGVEGATSIGNGDAGRQSPALDIRPLPIRLDLSTWFALIARSAQIAAIINVLGGGHVEIGNGAVSGTSPLIKHALAKSFSYFD